MAKARTLDVVGSKEAAHLLGMWPEAFSRLRRQGVVPDPDAKLAMGPVWWRSTIEDWAKLNGRWSE